MTFTPENAVSIGETGGKAGKGLSKRRGDSEHYRNLALKRWKMSRTDKPSDGKQAVLSLKKGTYAD